jgi:hypothetical protein
MGQMVRTGTQLVFCSAITGHLGNCKFQRDTTGSLPFGKKVKMTAEAYPKETFTGL